jgi:hypothetical protein
MDLEALKKLPREVQIILGGAVLYVIFSFFDWQQVSGFGQTVGFSLWHSFWGVLVALVAIILLAWEITRLLDVKINTGPLSPGQVSAGLALLLFVMTVITFLDWSQVRHWPEWVGLILSIAIAGAAFVRAKGEGVTMPDMPKNISVGGSGASTAPPAPAPPAATDDAAPASDSVDA